MSNLVSPLKPSYMKEKTTWTRIVYIVGVIAFIAGTLDPMEGSVIIAAGSVLIALSTYLTNDRHNKTFITTSILILSGVFFLFYFSSLGGFGGRSSLSWWWGLLILPYPVGWLINLIVLISRWMNIKRKNN